MGEGNIERSWLLNLLLPFTFSNSNFPLHLLHSFHSLPCLWPATCLPLLGYLRQYLYMRKCDWLHWWCHPHMVSCLQDTGRSQWPVALDESLGCTAAKMWKLACNPNGATIKSSILGASVYNHFINSSGTFQLGWPQYLLCSVLCKIILSSNIFFQPIYTMTLSRLILTSFSPSSSIFMLSFIIYGAHLFLFVFSLKLNVLWGENSYCYLHYSS